MRRPGSANITRSPGRSDDQTGRTRCPEAACSRDVRGSRVPCFANTYCVNPEQSNPVFGEVPHHRYVTPRYRSAVGRTREAEVVEIFLVDFAPTLMRTGPIEIWARAALP